MNLTPLQIIVLISTILEFNPLFQAIKNVRDKSVENVSPYTFISIMAIGGLWLYYGVTIGDLPLIVGNTIKLFTATIVIITFAIYRKRSSADKV